MADMNVDINIRGGGGEGASSTDPMGIVNRARSEQNRIDSEVRNHHESMMNRADRMSSTISTARNQELGAAHSESLRNANAIFRGDMSARNVAAGAESRFNAAEASFARGENGPVLSKSMAAQVAAYSKQVASNAGQNRISQDSVPGIAAAGGRGRGRGELNSLSTGLIGASLVNSFAGGYSAAVNPLMNSLEKEQAIRGGMFPIIGTALGATFGLPGMIIGGAVGTGIADIMKAAEAGETNKRKIAEKYMAELVGPLRDAGITMPESQRQQYADIATRRGEFLGSEQEKDIAALNRSSDSSARAEKISRESRNFNNLMDNDPFQKLLGFLGSTGDSQTTSRSEGTGN